MGQIELFNYLTECFLISQIIQIRRTRQTGFCMWSRNELKCDVSLEIPTPWNTSGSHPEKKPTNINSKRTTDAVKNLSELMNDSDWWRERERQTDGERERERERERIMGFHTIRTIWCLWYLLLLKSRYYSDFHLKVLETIHILTPKTVPL